MEKNNICWQPIVTTLVPHASALTSPLAFVIVLQIACNLISVTTFYYPLSECSY